MHYDINNDGRIDRVEMRRMIKDINLEDLHVSDALLDRFLKSEWGRIDVDNSGALCLEEFTVYVTNMACFMRDEMLAPREAQVTQIAARAAVEASSGPVALPPPIPTANGGVASVIEARKFGVSVEVPEGALPDGSMLSVATFAEQRIANLTESESARHGEFAFSPIVQVRAYSRDGRPLADTAASLGAPLTLVMPHAFCPSEGLESIVMLGAPTHADAWQRVQTDVRGEELDHSPIALDGGSIRVELPFLGVFCAFSSPEVKSAVAHTLTALAEPSDH